MKPFCTSKHSQVIFSTVHAPLQQCIQLYIHQLRHPSSLIIWFYVREVAAEHAAAVTADIDDVILGQQCIEVVTDLFVAQLWQHIIIYSLYPFDCL